MPAAQGRPPRLHPPTPNVTLSFTLLIASSSSTSIKSSLNFPLVPVSSVLSRHFQFFFSFLNDEHENWVRYISGVFIHIYLDLPQSSTVFSLLRSDVMLSGHSLPCYLFSVSFLRLIFALLLFPAHDTSACQPGPWGGLSLPLSPPAKSLPK